MREFLNPDDSMNWLEREPDYNRFSPYQNKQLYFKGPKAQQETEAEKALAAVASEEWERSKQIGEPLTKQFIETVDNQNTEAAHDASKGIANEQTAKEFSEARGDLTDYLVRQGVNPNDGKFKGTTGEMADDQATSTGDNMSRADVSQDEEYAAGLLNTVALGRGEAASASMGMGGLAEASANKAKSDAYNSFQKRSANMEAVGTVAGAATRYGLKDWGNSSTPDVVAGRQGDSDFTNPGLDPGQMFT